MNSPKAVISSSMRFTFWIILFAGVLPAAADSARDGAPLIFNAYSNAFYVVNGTNAWFKADQTGGIADFWEQAEEIECIIDTYERSPTTRERQMITSLLNGFVHNNGGIWTSNIYNDDCMWASIAFARGYIVTGE